MVPEFNKKMMVKSSWMTLSAWGILLVFTVLSGVQTQRMDSHRHAFYLDLATLQNVEYGLFNVDPWKERVVHILTEKLSDFKLKDENREKAIARIETLLSTVIHNLERNYSEDRSGSLMGLVESMTADMLGVFDQMKRDIPEMAITIVDFLDDSENREDLMRHLRRMIEKNAEEAVGSTNYDKTDAILDHYNIPEVERQQRFQEGIRAIKNQLATSEDTGITLKIRLAILFLLTAMALLWGCPSHIEVKLAVAVLLTWLILGISLPLIQIEAKIESLQFQFLSETIRFTDQILFHQSKSILDVIHLLLLKGKTPSTAAAGFGILLFSVLIPAAKLVVSFAWKPKTKWADSKAANALLFRSSKWAMADVMVVAIFLSHLGFEGVLQNQMNRLETASAHVEILTTSGSTLLTGFLAFFGFALLGILLSNRIQTLRCEAMNQDGQLALTNSDDRHCNPEV